jgi:hypothetical protein
MNAVLTHRKYRIGLRWAAEVGRTHGLWALIAFAALMILQLGLRLAVSFEGDLSVFVLRYLPFVLTAVAWVYLVKNFPAAITTGMTRKEFLAAYALFGAIVIIGGVALTQLVKVVHNLVAVEGAGGLDLYGVVLLETLIRMAVYFTAGSAAGAVMARFPARGVGAALAGVVIAALIFRPIPFQLLFTEFAAGKVFEVEFPGSEELLAPFDAVLTLVFVLVTWLALVRAPMPHSKA